MHFFSTKLVFWPITSDVFLDVIWLVKRPIGEEEKKCKIWAACLNAATEADLDSNSFPWVRNLNHTFQSGNMGTQIPVVQLIIKGHRDQQLQMQQKTRNDGKTYVM